MTQRDIPHDTRLDIWLRDGGRCRRCKEEGTDIHHRLPRKMGGTTWEHIHDPDLLVLLCRSCHAWVESNRAQANEEGWLLGEAWRSMIDKGRVPPPPKGWKET